MIYKLMSLDTLMHTVKTNTENHDYDAKLTSWYLDFNQWLKITAYLYVHQVSMKHESKRELYRKKEYKTKRDKYLLGHKMYIRCLTRYWLMYL